MDLDFGLSVSLVLKFSDILIALVTIKFTHVQFEGEPKSSKQHYGMAFVSSSLSMIWGSILVLQQVGALVTPLSHMLL